MWESGISSVPSAVISGELIDYSAPSAATTIRDLSIISTERERKPIASISATNVLSILRRLISEKLKNRIRF